MLVTTSVGFHEGELAVQRHAGVSALAARLAGMLDPPYLGGGLRRFLLDRTFALMTARDRDGVLWISPLTGPPGFLDGHDEKLRIGAVPTAGDPLHDLSAGQPIGLITIDLATRRRLRINGSLVAVEPTGLKVEVDQAYGNCPQYIQQRILHPEAATTTPARASRRSTILRPEQVELIHAADTFFLGTIHPERGADASHRGGAPGFVRADETGLWWPDYPGNNMFNSFGNLAVDDTAAILFIDFIAGTTLHLTGMARVEWFPQWSPGDDGGTGRRARFTVNQVVDVDQPALRASGVARYPRNPPLSDDPISPRPTTGR
jgi:hypothetical protein